MIQLIMWIIFALLSALFGALTSITAKFALKEINSNILTIIRSWIMSILLTVFGFILYLVGRLDLNFKTVSLTSIIALILAALFGATSWLFYFLALKQGKVSVVYALDKLSILFVIILAFIFFSEKITIKTIVGGLFLFVGVLLIK